MREPLKGELLMLAITMLRLATLGRLLIVKNCCPKELDRVHGILVLLR